MARGPWSWKPPCPDKGIVRAGASRAYRELEATQILVYHVLDLLRSHHIHQSEHGVILHAASELGDAVGAVRQPGAGAGAAGTSRCRRLLSRVQLKWCGLGRGKPWDG